MALNLEWLPLGYSSSPRSSANSGCSSPKDALPSSLAGLPLHAGTKAMSSPFQIQIGNMATVFHTVVEETTLDFAAVNQPASPTSSLPPPTKQGTTCQASPPTPPSLSPSTRRNQDCPNKIGIGAPAPSIQSNSNSPFDLTFNGQVDKSNLVAVLLLLASSAKQTQLRRSFSLPTHCFVPCNVPAPAHIELGSSTGVLSSIHCSSFELQNQAHPPPGHPLFF